MNAQSWSGSPPGTPTPYGSSRPYGSPTEPAPVWERPSYAPTILITLFFGIFGLIPAARHSRMARERGYKPNGYWWAFGGTALGDVMLSVGVVAAIVVGLGSTTSGLSSSAGTSQKPTSSPGTAAAPQQTVPETTSNTSVPTTTSPTTVAALPGVPVMAGLASDLAQSANARPAVQNAINGVESCQLNPADGMNALQGVIETRDQILTGLQERDTTQLSGGAELDGELTTALDDSVTADQDYETWMQDFADYGYQCGSDPTADSSYNAGQSESAVATQDKATFVANWNALAPQYGLPTYQESGF